MTSDGRQTVCSVRLRPQRRPISDGRGAISTNWPAAQIEVRSAGTEPAEKINPVAVRAMAEEGIDIATERPKLLTTETVKASDVVITMGCGDTCPYYPGKRYEDWVLDDPAGQDLNHGRAIRDQIRPGRKLIDELLP